MMFHKISKTISFCLGIFIVHLFLLSSLYASKNPESIVEFYVRNYTDDDGLPQNSVESIVKDEVGNIWMSTQSGIVKFDGSKFRVYHKKDLGTSSERFLMMAKYPFLDDVYSINWDRQIVRIKNGVPHILDTNSTEYIKIVKVFKKSAFRNVFYEVDYMTDYDKQSSAVYRIEEDVYYTLRGFEFKYFEQNRLKYRVKFPEGNQVEMDKNLLRIVNRILFYFEYDKIYSITEKGVQQVRLKIDGVYQPYVAGAKYRMFSRKEDDSQNFLIDDRNLYQIVKSDAQVIELKTLIKDYPFGALDIKSVFYDRPTESFFIGSGYKGLYHFVPKKFKVYKINALRNNIYYGHIEYQPGKILAGYGSVFDLHQSNTRFHSLENLTDSWIYIKDNQGNIWTKKSNRVHVLNGGNFRLLKSFVMDDDVSSIGYDSINDVIYASVLKVNKLKSIKAMDFLSSNFEKVADFNDHAVSIFLIDDLIYITAYNGLHTFNPTSKEMKMLPGSDGFYTRFVYKTHPQDSIIWTCVEGKGIYAYNGETFKRVPLDKKEYLLFSHAIVEDQFENFWISCNKGIFKVPKQSLYDYLNNGSSVFYSYYNKNNGFRTNEFNGGGYPSVTKLSDGNIAFPSMDGIVVFDPAEIIPYQFSEYITINSIFMGEENVPISDTIIWSDRNSNLTIELSTPYYGSSEDVKYLYKIDNKALSTSNDGVIQFNSLSVGTHILTIYIPYKNIKGQYTKKEIVIRVLPFWYETRLSHVIFFILIVLVFSSFYILRVKSLEKENQRLEVAVKNRTSELVTLINSLEESKSRLDKELYFQQSLNSNISHNIKTPLRYLMSSIGKFYQSLVKQGDERNIHEASNIYSASQELYKSTEQFVEYMKAANKLGNPQIEKVQLSALIDEVYGFYSKFIDSRKVSFVNYISPKYIVEAPKDFLKVIFSNFVDNSLKHAQASRIEISAYVDELEDLCIRIKDDGKGIGLKNIQFFNKFYNGEPTSIKEEYLELGIGLFTIKEMLPFVGASVEFLQVEKGAEILIVFSNYVTDFGE